MSIGPGSGPQPPAGWQQGAPPMRREDERLWAIGAHLGPLLIGVFAPLIVWLVFRQRSPFLERSAREALNMQISYTIYFAVAGFSIFLLVGLLLLPLVGLVWFILVVIGTVKAGSLEDYRYPLVFRWVT